MIDENEEGGCLQRSKPNASARESDRKQHAEKKPSEGHRDKSESAFAVGENSTKPFIQRMMKA
ncbi:hypothetical protein LNP17_25610 [Klebsiella variicola subsp. variicola]|nr:hypothetical protein [Klebsiella variicola subsp. variicola]